MGQTLKTGRKKPARPPTIRTGPGWHFRLEFVGQELQPGAPTSPDSCKVIQAFGGFYSAGESLHRGASSENPSICRSNSFIQARFYMRRISARTRIGLRLADSSFFESSPITKATSHVVLRISCENRGGTHLKSAFCPIIPMVRLKVFALVRHLSHHWSQKSHPGAVP